MDSFTADFIKNWWKASSKTEFMDWFKTTKKGGETEHASMWVSNYVRKIRASGIPMKYLGALPATIDKKAGLALLEELGIPEDEIEEATKAQQNMEAGAKKRQEKMKKDNKKAGRPSTKK